VASIASSRHGGEGVIDWAEHESAVGDEFVAVRVRRLVGGDEQDVGADLVDVGEAGDRLVVDSGD
jgi:hypothetical protein